MKILADYKIDFFYRLNDQLAGYVFDDFHYQSFFVVLISI